jgi:hypothetical protein
MELTVRGARLAMQRRRALEARRGENISINSRGTVVVVLAMTATNDQATLDRAKEEMRMCKEMMPGTILPNYLISTSLYNEYTHEKFLR